MVSALTPYKDLQLQGVDAEPDRLVAVVNQWHPDIAVINASSSRHKATMVVRALNGLRGKPNVLVISNFKDENFILTCLKYQVSAFLLDDLSVEELYGHFSTLVEGGAVLSPPVAKLLIGQFAYLNQTGLSGTTRSYQKSKLSATEQTIVDWVVRGASNKQIAHELFLSEGTVRNYLSDIFAKLGVKGRTQLAIWAVSQESSGEA